MNDRQCRKYVGMPVMWDACHVYAKEQLRRKRMMSGCRYRRSKARQSSIHSQTSSVQTMVNNTESCILSLAAVMPSLENVVFIGKSPPEDSDPRPQDCAKKAGHERAERALLANNIQGRVDRMWLIRLNFSLGWGYHERRKKRKEKRLVSPKFGPYIEDAEFSSLPGISFLTVCSRAGPGRAKGVRNRHRPLCTRGHTCRRLRSPVTRACSVSYCTSHQMLCILVGKAFQCPRTELVRQGTVNYQRCHCKYR